MTAATAATVAVLQRMEKWEQRDASDCEGSLATPVLGDDDRPVASIRVSLSGTPCSESCYRAAGYTGNSLLLSAGIRVSLSLTSQLLSATAHSDEISPGCRYSCC